MTSYTSPSPSSMGTDDNWFSENDEAQSDIMSSDGFEVVCGPGEASNMTMPFSDSSELRSSEITVADIVNCAFNSNIYPRINAKEFESISFSTQEASYRVANTVIYLLGTPSRDKARRVLNTLAAKFPVSLKVDLRWWVSVFDDYSTDFAPRPTDKLSGTLPNPPPPGRWVGFNSHDQAFYEIPQPSGSFNSSGHNIFVLYYSSDSSSDATALFDEVLDSELGAVAVDSLIVPLTDYLLDPRSAGCQRIPASKRSPLVEIKYKGKACRVPYTVSQLDALSLDQLLQKGLGKKTLSHWNAQEKSTATLVGLVVLANLLLGYLLLVASAAFGRECVALTKPWTWPGIASQQVWLYDNCPSDLNWAPVVVPPMVAVPSTLPPAESPRPGSLVLERMNHALDVIVKDVNFALGAVATAGDVVLEHAIAVWKRLVREARELSFRLRNSKRVQTYKEEQRAARPQHTTLGYSAATPTPGFSTAEPADGLCPADDTTLMDVGRAYSAAAWQGMRDLSDAVKSHELSQRFAEETRRLGGKIPPRAYLWLTRPRETWRDDAVRKAAQLPALCKTQLAAAGKRLWSVNLQKPFERAKAADWSVRHASEVIRQRLAESFEETRREFAEDRQRLARWVSRLRFRGEFAETARGASSRLHSGCKWLKAQLGLQPTRKSR